MDLLARHARFVRFRVALVALVAMVFSLPACAPTAPGPAAAVRPDLLPAEADALRSAGVAGEQVTCSGRNRWSQTLRAEAKETAGRLLETLGGLGVQIPEDKREAVRGEVVDAIFWRMVLTQLVDGELHNLGVVPLGRLQTPTGAPALLFRTGFTADPDREGSCVDSLVRAGVRHGVNLYAGPMPTEGLEAAEEKRLLAAGGTYFSARRSPELAKFRENLRDADPEEARQAAMPVVAKLINEQILRPGGAAPRGHVQVHCGGGMHRTGMVVGVIERCLNGTPMNEVEAHYKRHIGWRSATEPGGYEAQNVAFISKFDCALLDAPR